MLVVVVEVEGMLVELGETTFESFKEKHEKGMMVALIMEKQVNVINESIIIF
jgi:hypothetical protein